MESGSRDGVYRKLGPEIFRQVEVNETPAYFQSVDHKDRVNKIANTKLYGGFAHREA